MGSSDLIEAVLFDFDGTITTPGHLDFTAIRQVIGCPAGVSILTYIASLAPGARSRAESILDKFELEAAGEVSAAPGLEELLDFLTARSVPIGLLTRNTRRAVLRSLERIQFCPIERFACVITRDDELRVKPEPDCVLEAAKRMGTRIANLLVAGDYIYDIEAGRRAGARTLFLDVLPERTFPAPDFDYVAADLRSMITLLASMWP